MLTELEKQWLQDEEDEIKQHELYLAQQKEDSSDEIPMRDLSDSMFEEDFEEDPSTIDWTEVEEAQENEAIMQDMYIANPLVSDIFVPMGLIESGGKKYIGGLLNLDVDASSCIMVYPMEIVEQRQLARSQVGNTPAEYSVSFAMQYVHPFLGEVHDISFEYNSLYIFLNSRVEDLSIVGNYNMMCQNYRQARLGLAQPTPEEVAKVNSAKS